MGGDYRLAKDWDPDAVPDVCKVGCRYSLLTDIGAILVRVFSKCLEQLDSFPSLEEQGRTSKHSRQIITATSDISQSVTDKHGRLLQIRRCRGFYR